MYEVKMIITTIEKRKEDVGIRGMSSIKVLFKMLEVDKGIFNETM